MIEWTTPTRGILISGVDVTACDVYVTIAQKHASVTVEPDSMTYDADTGTTLTVSLTQEQTGGFRAGPAKLQVNAIDSNGYRAATRQVLVAIDSNLMDEEVSYGYNA